MSSRRYSIVVPARLHSTRLPEKLLLAQSGQPLLAHTLENIQPLRKEADLWLVTDHEKLAGIGKPLVDHVHLSTKEFNSGTERLIEVVPQIEHSWVLNVQADEPEISVDDLSAFMDEVLSIDGFEMATLGTPFKEKAMLENPNAVKVVTGQAKQAIYFSRQSIPHGGTPETRHLLHHLGVYAYTKSLLQRWPRLKKGPLESTERLEQLRALENGVSIMVHQVSCAAKGIDTLDDYQEFLKRQTVS